MSFVLGLRGFEQGVFQIVGMLAVSNLDVERACDPFEVAGSGAGDDGDGHLAAAWVHHCGMLQDEAAVLALQRAGYDFDGDVAGLAVLGISGGEHLAFGGRFEIAVDLLVDGKAGNAVGWSGG